MSSRKLYAERPGWGKDFDYDEGRHLAAYIKGAELAPGLRVLDAGCGEGYGTQTLPGIAGSVVGVDYSAEAIATCRERWTAPNLEFRVCDLTEPPAADERFDLILNFQVIEHIEYEPPFLEGLRARLAPDGTVMITTPNVLMSFSENPCHVREYTPEEFERLLRGTFSSVELSGVFGNEKVRAFDLERRRAIERILKLDPLGIRNVLPQGLLFPIFARLGQFVRRSAHRTSSAGNITPEDFEFSADGLEEALDLVALCRI